MPRGADTEQESPGCQVRVREACTASLLKLLEKLFPQERKEFLENCAAELLSIISSWHEAQIPGEEALLKEQLDEMEMQLSRLRRDIARASRKR